MYLDARKMGDSEAEAMTSYRVFADAMTGLQARRGMNVEEYKVWLWRDICEGHERHIRVWRSRGNDSEVRKLELELIGDSLSFEVWQAPKLEIGFLE